MDNILLDRIYEFPLNNRMRYFLRYESLASRLEKDIQQNHYHNTIEVLRLFFELLELTKNVDLKSETMHQLRWQIQTLEKFSNHPQIKQHDLQKIISKKNKLLPMLETMSLNSLTYQNHHFLNAVKRRLEIPGGICSFDIPLLTSWLQLPLDQQLQNIREWNRPFTQLYESISDCLALSRNDGEFIEHTAKEGYYSQDFGDRKAHWQMLRIKMGGSAAVYPEISAGRPRFTIHFFSLGDLAAKPPQAKEDIQFKVALCQI